MNNLKINCSKNYNITVGNDILKDAGRILSPLLGSSRICVVTDETVQRLYGGEQSPLHESLTAAGFDVRWFAFPPGEQSKTFETLCAILDFLAENGFNRHDALVSLGGGVCGDLTGFAAATYMRGIKYVQIPTTLLSCVDSSIGGKTGVDLKAGKNLAGAFWHPETVIADMDVFDTLSEDCWLDGIGEMVKAGMIGDPDILTGFNAADIRSDADALADLILKALKVKADIVAADELEKDIRQLLNLGHTIGHAIEKCSDYEISHGQAIAAGMIVEAKAAESLGWSSSGNAALLESLLTKLKFPIDMLMARASNIGPEELAKAAMSDKKARGDNITIVYPMRPGLCRMQDLHKSKLEDFISRGL